MLPRGLDGPVIRCVNETFEREPLEDLCNVTGNPAPVVLWRKDGKLTDPAVRLSRENAGTYVVEAEGASNVKEVIHLAVLCEYPAASRLAPRRCSTAKECWFLLPDGPELSCPSVYTVLEHTPHNLTCTVEGYPNPNIIWYKDGEDVVLPENLTRRDAGQYLIVAESMLATVNASVDITVFCELWDGNVSASWHDLAANAPHLCFQTRRRRSLSLKTWKLRSARLVGSSAPPQATHDPSTCGTTTRPIT